MDLIVVDAQNDFISGSLACQEADTAMEAILQLIRSGKVDHVYYTADHHSPANGSFQENGGIWPVHCVAGTHGAALWEGFSEAGALEPKPETTFLKGLRDDVEEYSAAAGKNDAGKTLTEVAGDEVIVAGLASEYCVRETTLDLMRAGKRVTFYRPGVGYVDRDDHEKNIADLRAKGIEILEA